VRWGCTHQAETDDASEAQILGIAPDFRVREKQRHGDQYAVDHPATSMPEELGATWPSASNDTGNPSASHWTLSALRLQSLRRPVGVYMGITSKPHSIFCSAMFR
jgi:hypothetical protein